MDLLVSGELKTVMQIYLILQPGIDDFEITVDVLDSNGNIYQTYIRL